MHKFKQYKEEGEDESEKANTAEDEDNLPSTKKTEITGIEYVEETWTLSIVSVGWDKWIYVWPDCKEEQIENPKIVPPLGI